jgi:hypothetical protein
VRVDRVGLAALTGVEHPHPRGQLRGHVEDRFAVGDQALGEVPADSAAALDCPDAVGEPAAGREHLLVTDGVRAVPAPCKDFLPFIDDFDRGRPLVRIHPDHYATHALAFLTGK